MELASDSSLNGDSSNQGGLVAQTDATQLVVAGYGHYVDGRGKNIMLLELDIWGVELFVIGYETEDASSNRSPPITHYA